MGDVARCKAECEDDPNRMWVIAPRVRTLCFGTNLVMLNALKHSILVSTAFQCYIVTTGSRNIYRVKSWENWELCRAWGPHLFLDLVTDSVISPKLKIQTKVDCKAQVDHFVALLSASTITITMWPILPWTPGHLSEATNINTADTDWLAGWRLLLVTMWRAPQFKRQPELLVSVFCLSWQPIRGLHPWRLTNERLDTEPHLLFYLAME